MPSGGAPSPSSVMTPEAASPEAVSSEAQEPHPEVLPRGLVIAGMAIESIALNLAQALLKGFGGKVGALAWNQLFGGGVPSYFGEVYQEIRRIVSVHLTPAGQQIARMIDPVRFAIFKRKTRVHGMGKMLGSIIDLGFGIC